MMTKPGCANPDDERGSMPNEEFLLRDLRTGKMPVPLF